MFQHLDASHLICRVNELTGFYMMGTLTVNGSLLRLQVVPFASLSSSVTYLYLILLFVDIFARI